MNEKIIVKSAPVTGIKIAISVLLVIGLILGWTNSVSYTLFDGFNHYFWTSILPYCMSIYFLPFAVVALLIYLSAARTELTVTNKRVYGKAMFGRRVDLPVDSISAVGTSIFSGVSVSTSSGRISFLGVKNRDEIHEEISKLLMERQEKATATTIMREIPQSNADELKKYKELLDNGIISQEEFDAKKKQLLGL